MTSLDHPGIRKVVAELAAAGMEGPAGRLRVLAAEVRTAADAAAALQVPVGAIANSLIFRAGDEPLLVLTSGAHRADTSRLAELVGVDRLGRADAEFVRTHTGQAIGGVAPVGHPAPITTIVDVALAEYDTIWAAAGHPKSIFPLSYAELVELTGGTPAEVAATAVSATTTAGTTGAGDEAPTTAELGEVISPHAARKGATQ